MNINQETLNDILEAAKPIVIEGLKNELKTSITYQVKADMLEEVRKHVQKWIEKELLPEVTKILIESKDGLICVGAQLGENIIYSMVEQLTLTVKKNLEQSWTRKKIFEALFD